MLSISFRSMVLEDMVSSEEPVVSIAESQGHHGVKDTLMHLVTVTVSQPSSIPPRDGTHLSSVSPGSLVLHTYHFAPSLPS